MSYYNFNDENGGFVQQQSFQDGIFDGHPQILQHLPQQHYAIDAQYGYPPHVQWNWQQNNEQPMQIEIGNQQYDQFGILTSQTDQQIPLTQSSLAMGQSVPQKELTQEQIKQLPLEAFNFLTPDEIKFLTPKQLDLISADTFKKYSKEQKTALRSLSRTHTINEKMAYFSSAEYKEIENNSMQGIIKEASEIFDKMIEVDKTIPSFIKPRTNSDVEVELGKKKKQLASTEMKEYTLEEKINCIRERIGELIYKIDPNQRTLFQEMMLASENGETFSNKDKHIYVCEKPNRWANESKNLGVKSNFVWLFHNHIHPLALALILKKKIPITTAELFIKLKSIGGCNSNEICINCFHVEFRAKTPFDRYRDKQEFGNSIEIERPLSIAPSQSQLTSSSAPTEFVAASNSEEGFYSGWEQ